MPHRRYVDFQDCLNRTLNKTVSRDRLTIFGTSATAPIVAIGYQAPGARNVFSSIRLGNNHYLSIRMDVGLARNSVSTIATSISYRCSPEMRSEDWIIRYEYERGQAEAGSYPYPVSHLHVNAEPRWYRGAKPFPDLHLPTRRLSLEEIIRHLIVEHDVPTLGPKQDALDFLDEQQADFERNRTDPGRPSSAR